MEAAAADEPQRLESRLAEARERLDDLVRSLRAVEGELEAIATERRQHSLLHDACRALEELRSVGGAGLFWGEGAGADRGEEHVRRARGRVEAFESKVADIEDRRRGILEEITRQQGEAASAEDDLFEALEEEERRRLEWIIEREISAARARESMMPWARGGEDDRRFRKSLGMALLVCLLFALAVHLVRLPLLELTQPPAQIPKRVVTMMIEMQRRPPPVPEPPPPHPLKQVTRQKAVAKPIPQRVAKPDAKPRQQSEKPAPQEGLLAFRHNLAAIKDTPLAAQLGRHARIRSADDRAVGLPQRSMLTTLAPGSSGGIRLASVSRGLGPDGGGERRAIRGGALTHVTSSIGSIAAARRPLSGGPGPGRTDEEIQIVFDRHKAELYRLYNGELRKDPTLQGKIILRLTIEPDGTVSLCRLQSTNMDAPQLAARVVDHVRTFNFGAKAVPAITIIYPIDFLPAT